MQNNETSKDLKSFNELPLSQQEKILVKARILKLKELDKIDKHLAKIRGGNIQH